MSTIVKKYYMSIVDDDDNEHIVTLRMYIPEGCERDDDLKATLQQVQTDWQGGELIECE